MRVKVVHVEGLRVCVGWAIVYKLWLRVWLTWSPSYVHEPNFMKHVCWSNGK